MTATHTPVDDGSGFCTLGTCGRRLADYGKGLQHRRGRRLGSPGRVRIPPVHRPHCRLCGRSRLVRTRQFTLIVDLSLPNLIRRRAGTTRLCEGCWRKLTA